MSDIPNATPLMRALDGAIRGELHAQPHPLHHLSCPWCCPEKLLPYLAWARSVDHWNDRWPVKVKRQVIADARELHRYKGTPGAVRRALASVHANSELIEWWENGGPIHTFEVTVEPTEELLGKDRGMIYSPALIAELRRVVDVAKPLRSHFGLTVRIRMESEASLTCGGSHQQFSEFSGTAIQRDHGGASEPDALISAGGAHQSYSRLAPTTAHPNVPDGLTHVSMTLIGTMMQDSILTMEALPPN